MKFKVVIIMAIVSFLAGGPWRDPVDDLAMEAEVLALSSPAPPAAEPLGESQEKPKGGHGNPFALVFGTFTLILVSAVIGRYAANRLKQSPVLGELIIGIIVGALAFQLGSPAVTLIRHFDLVDKVSHKVVAENLPWKEAVKNTLSETDLPEDTTKKLGRVFLSPDFNTHYTLARALQLFSSLGILLLLFMVGLECSVNDMRRVGGSATSVALLGVVVPFVLGFTVTRYLVAPEGDLNLAIFIGATLCATSIGITARVFRDMYSLEMREAKIVLGAAVLDDILGLIVLAVVTGIVTAGMVNLMDIGLIFAKAILFFVVVILFGAYYLKRDIRFYTKLDQGNIKLIYPFGLMMLCAWLADFIGLASIIGAFAAGLIIEERCFSKTQPCYHGHQTLESVFAPIEGIFAPVFFVLIGFMVDVTTFADWRVVLGGVGLTVVAILGKLASSLFLGKGQDRWIVGLGMVPRGEVGLIFASIGLALGVLDNKFYSIVIIVVMLTTLVTPPLLTWAIQRRERLIELEMDYAMGRRTK
jgi:Kef-type K+ transport system membrane component KefB